LGKLALVLIGLVCCGSSQALVLFCPSVPFPSDSQVIGYEDCLSVDSIQFGTGRSISSLLGGIREASKPTFSEVLLTRSLGTPSPQLFLEAAVGMSMGTVTFEFLETSCGGGSIVPYMQVQLGEVIVSSLGESSAGERPAESLSLNFTSICLRYNSCDGETLTLGTPRGYDLQTQTLTTCNL
jgi:type VI secretion system secreted protein Hcp